MSTKRCILLLAAALTVTGSIHLEARAQAVLQVPTLEYPSIQQALDAAVDGDSVLVARGTYDESFTLVPGVTVRGAETAATFLTGVVDVALDGGGTLESFTVQDTAWIFRRAIGLAIRNCVITRGPANGVAVLVEDSIDTEIANNVFYANDTGLQIRNEPGGVSSTGNILANAFVGNSLGLRDPVAGVTGSHNLFFDNGIDEAGGDTGISPVPGDPLFVDPTNGDFHLLSDSPCIDVVPPATLTDPDGSDADCGAYGGPNQDPNPGQVTGLTVAAGAAENSAELTWTVDGNYLVKGYRVHYGTAPGNYDGTRTGEEPSPVTITGRTIARATLNNLTASASPPPPPADFDATPGDGRLFLSWSAAAGATGYTVLFGTESGTYTGEVDVEDSTSYVLGGLTNGVTYFLAVRPYASTEYFFAVSALGTTAVAAPPDPTPEPPEGQLSIEASVLLDKTEGIVSAEVSEFPERASGYPVLEDGGFCFVRTLRRDPAHPAGRPAALALALLLLAGGIAAAQRGKRGLLLLILVLAMTASAGSTRAADSRWSLDARVGAFWPSEEDWDKHYNTDPQAEVKLGVGYSPTAILEFGVEAGYRRAEGKVRRTDSGRRLAQNLDQSLTVVPLQGYALVRLQFSEEQLMVPYLAGGLSSYLYQHEVDGDRRARGRTEGYHARAGLRVSLNRFDPRSAARSRQQYRLLGTGLTVEGQYARVDDFGSSETDLGGWSLLAGLSLLF